MAAENTSIPPEAVGVLKAFLDAAQRRDEEAMKACLDRRTLESGQFRNAGPEDTRFILGEPFMEGEQVIIPAKAYPNDAPADAAPVMEMACQIVKEDGQWKFDLAGTVERMFGGDLGKVVEQVTTAMADAMKGVGEAISEAIGGAFGGTQAAGEEQPTDEDRAWDVAPLTPSAEELRPLPEMTELPKTQAAISEAIDSPVLVQAAITDLLRQLGSDERQGLIDWLDGQLFAGWGELFDQAARQVSVSGRLRAIRIEAASGCENRILVLDGSDLVYRVFLNHTDGYHSDAEVATMLSGVLAGLPETIDASIAGQRLLPTDDEGPTVEDYHQRIVPRYMRRIREFLGRPVRLEVDWARVAECSNAGASSLAGA